MLFVYGLRDFFMQSTCTPTLRVDASIMPWRVVPVDAICRFTNTLVDHAIYIRALYDMYYAHTHTHTQAHDYYYYFVAFVAYR